MDNNQSNIDSESANESNVSEVGYSFLIPILIYYFKLNEEKKKSKYESKMSTIFFSIFICIPSTELCGSANVNASNDKCSEYFHTSNW